MERNWREAPLADLIDHILVAFHRPLDVELPRLEALARSTVEQQESRTAGPLTELLSTYLELRAELESHMAKEERILFPMIRSGSGSMATAPISVMKHEHDTAQRALFRLRRLAGDYELPASADENRRELWLGLEALEQSLCRHIELENEILFPRALAGAAP